MKKALPIGITDYQELKSENYYAVDKTMMIYDFLKAQTKVTLITRPRRFGKTLNMSMMAEFFDITKDSKEIFKDTKIMETKYAAYLNQYPVIYLSFAGAKGSRYEIVKQIKLKIRDIYDRYEFIFTKLSRFKEDEYHKVVLSLMGIEDERLDNATNSLSFLMEQMQKYYNKKVMVFIDEYDTPFIEAHAGGFYDDIRQSLSSLLHNALKTSNSLQYGMLTGIQRVAKENIFSELNNLSVYTVGDEAYSKYFGFTTQETKELLEYYQMELNEEVKKMYDGYHIGNQDIYNPWSIINYAANKQLRPYWVNTSSNKMIKTAINEADKRFYQEYEQLIKEGKLDTWVWMETSFFEVSSTESLWGLLINAGYLTIEKIIDQTDGYCTIKVPNQELQREFRTLTSYHLHIDENELSRLFQSLIYERKEVFKQMYQEILLTLPSYHDLKDENSYHMMVLGMSAWLKAEYEIKSNQESGKGRSDIILKARNENKPSYVIEFKYTRDKKVDLKDLAKEAIDQIIDNRYDMGLKGRVIYIGLAHRQKQCEVLWRQKEG